MTRKRAEKALFGCQFEEPVKGVDGNVKRQVRERVSLSSVAGPNHE